MLTGITEPLEFTFLFVAPFLYVIHSIFAGMAYMFMHIFNVGVGMTFSGGFIDLSLFGILQGNDKTNWIWVVIVGIVYFIVYYFLFTFLIKKFNLQTPGREKDQGDVKLYTRADVEKNEIKGDLSSTSALICKGLGGKANISDVDCCATRLRITVFNADHVDEQVLKASGAKGVVKKGNGVQVIYGPQVSVIKSDLEEYLATHDEVENVEENQEEHVFITPLEGRVCPLSETPDESFAQEMLGKGLVIFPTDNILYAPCDATIEFVFPTKHAVGLKSETGLEMLLHVGIYTVKLEGKGFEVHVEQRQQVKQGDKLMTFDVQYIQEHATSTATTFIFTNLAEDQEFEIITSGDVKANEPILKI